MATTDRPLDEQLRAALDAAETDTARYHLREALQLRIAERSLREHGRDGGFGGEEGPGEASSA
ncbi:hypothetical protein [Haloarcula onubensis]|uniref:Uncharacterized protein n=1 Tax=Haloarcula onubensis TaxID=2950539 RepID=A0ABU2FLU2_9EURY|nr:hypothetical protein [Halomicroarcula sp. S3CR25-11]MDS0281725.1 hypothetical protein [Halomicroarcula sp. S3CR25-11]